MRERERERERDNNDKTKDNEIRFKEDKDIHESVLRKMEYYHSKNSFHLTHIYYVTHVSTYFNYVFLYNCCKEMYPFSPTFTIEYK